MVFSKKKKTQHLPPLLIHKILQNLHLVVAMNWLHLKTLQHLKYDFVQISKTS